MYFVPEGQHDSSQVRSAWAAIQEDRRPGGTVEVIFSPKAYCYYVLNLAPNLSPDRFNRPAGTGLFSS
jgi:hypothetical protein